MTFRGGAPSRSGGVCVWHRDSVSVARIEPTGPARSGRPDDRLREIRGSPLTSHIPAFAALKPGYEIREHDLLPSSLARTSAQALHARRRVPVRCARHARGEDAGLARPVGNTRALEGGA